ncbi:MAG TPA: class I SAM-dependent methyltransferase [Burkholderiaceae bacterium]|nr:class I SAM-dependent methyltransferase [Burkholderiaceae bacterium]
MWRDSWFGKSARRVAAQAVESGLQRLAESSRQGGLPGLDLVLPSGERIHFGKDAEVVLRIRDDGMLATLAHPTISDLAEGFVDGRLDVEGPMLRAVAIAEKLAESGGAPVSARVAAALGRHSQRHDKEAVSYHYNVGNEFYRAWLDERMVYSCAYFRTGNESLDEAQVAKLDHVCRKLRLTPGERLLDIGCGWGGMAMHAARNYGVRAVGITLSENQWKLANERIAQSGLSDRAEVLLLDYRDALSRFGAESFDKVSSIGMFEHVGLRNLPTYFGIVRDLLRERGLFLNHGITSIDIDNRPVGSGISEFIDKYVFPQGELPHLYLVVREMAGQAFEVFDVESLRPHYARTLAHWATRLEAKLPELRDAASDKTLRIWRAYLAGCSHGFAQHWLNIYQVLASKQTRPGPTGLPLTRDWIYER